MNVSPVSASAVTPEVISFKLLATPDFFTARDGREAVHWCASRGLSLASKSRHADLGAGGDEVDFVGVAALGALYEKRLSGALPVGSVLRLEGVPRRWAYHSTAMVMQLAELAAAGVTIVTMAGCERAWGEDLPAHMGSFLMTLGELVLLEEQRVYQSMRVRKALQARRKRLAQEAGEVTA